MATAALVFALVFRADGGLLNWALHFVGFSNIDWGNGEWTSKIAISRHRDLAVDRYNALIYLAAMQAVPTDLYEAASIDGATRWQQFRKVTIPSLRPTILFTIVISTIGSMQLFGEPLLLQGGTLGSIGGNEHQYETLSIYLFITAGSWAPGRPRPWPGRCSSCCCSSLDQLDRQPVRAQSAA